MSNTFDGCSRLKSWEACDGKLYNQQHSGCQASGLETIGAEQMTNKSVRKHPFLLIHESHRAVNAAMLFIPGFFQEAASWMDQTIVVAQTFMYVLEKHDPEEFPLFYNWCGGIWQRMTHCSCSHVCVFRMMMAKQDNLPGCVLHNKAFLSSLPLLGARRVHNPLNITCWKGSFTSSRWSNHKISLPNYPSTSLHTSQANR